MILKKFQKRISLPIFKKYFLFLFTIIPAFVSSFNRNKKYFLKVGNDTKEIPEEKIHSEILKLPKEMLENVTLTADEHLEYGYIVEVMSKLRNENVKNVSLNIQKNDK